MPLLAPNPGDATAHEPLHRTTFADLPSASSLDDETSGHIVTLCDLALYLTSNGTALLDPTSCPTAWAPL